MTQNARNQSSNGDDIPPFFGGVLNTGIIREEYADKNKTTFYGNKLDESNKFPQKSDGKKNDQMSVEHASERKQAYTLASIDSKTTQNYSEPDAALNSTIKVYHHQPPPTSIDPRGSQKHTDLLINHSNPNKVFNHNIADMLKKKYHFKVINKHLNVWDPALRHYVGLVGENADQFIRRNVPENFKGLITTKSIEEITKWLFADEKLKVDEKLLNKQRAYLPYSNCVVKFSDLTVHNHSPDFYFTSVINAEYPLNKPSYGKNFENWISQITDQNRAKYMRFQELFGYVLSEIRDVKVIPFLLGPKDSGKSILLKLLIHMVGEEYTTNLSLDEMNKPDYLCQLFGKKLNACGEISELPLNRLDTLKKLSGGDHVMARFLYSNAIKFVNEAALLFAGNHLPTIKGIDRSNAFSQRVRIFPTPNQVPKEEQDIHLLDKLLEEKSYIAKWSIQGLQRWSQNNFQFTSCEEIEELALMYTDNNNSIRSFLKTCCFRDPESREHNADLFPAYINFCSENDFIPESDKGFHKYLQQDEGLRHGRFRKNNLNLLGYYGIALYES